ncbi:MAG: UDP-N-acetylmuramoyl-L-alanyl-D-glutamate--2,6-diaminopimelate ligase, partial [Clostridia bacterium]|nr:UDP-N-acetylmuramoyl-L-alanyl-D-glutamate--2,6-diaminopimelate ligase [Clostridia bacterium]
MKLSNLLKEIEYEVLQGDINCETTDLVYDSRKITEKSVFVCLVGANVDGHSFVNQAVLKGASAVIVEKAVSGMPENMAVIKV